MNSAFYVEIPKSRAEYPALIVGALLCFVGWAIHYGFFGWQGGMIWLLIALPLYLFLFMRFKGVYFIQVDEEAISWRQGLLSRYVKIPWKYMKRVDYLVFEINFQIQESGQVVSFGTSGLTDDQTDQLKQAISDMVALKLKAGEI